MVSRHVLKRLCRRASAGTKDVSPGELLWAPLLPAEQRHASKPPSLVDCSGTICFPQIPSEPQPQALPHVQGLEPDWKLKSSSDRSAGCLALRSALSLVPAQESTVHPTEHGAAVHVGSPERAPTYRSPVIQSHGSCGLQLAAECRGIWLGCTLAAHSLHRRTGPEAIPSSSLSRARLTPVVRQVRTAWWQLSGGGLGAAQPQALSAGAPQWRGSLQRLPWRFCCLCACTAAAALHTGK